MSQPYPIISADSHITEPPDCYTAHIDPRFRDQAPHMVTDDRRGSMFVIPGMRNPIAMGLVAAAGKLPEEITEEGVRFEDLHRSGWDPTHRLADQDRDGVSAEVIYPTVGMLLCNHEDFDYKKACFDAYNRWIAGYCAEAPHRLLGVGQTALRSVEEGIADLEAIAAAGAGGDRVRLGRARGPGEEGGRPEGIHQEALAGGVIGDAVGTRRALEGERLGQLAVLEDEDAVRAGMRHLARGAEPDAGVGDVDLTVRGGDDVVEEGRAERAGV